MSPHRAPTHRREARSFADTWADAWNRRDLDAVLELFADDIVFDSPKALAIVGTARVEGKVALRSYWQAALARIQSLKFDVDDVVFDPEQRCLVVVYRASLNGVAVHAAEHLRFSADGRIIHGAGYYGAPVATGA